MSEQKIFCGLIVNRGLACFFWLWVDSLKKHQPRWCSRCNERWWSSTHIWSQAKVPQYVLLSIRWPINHFCCFRRKSNMSVCKYCYKTIKLCNLGYLSLTRGRGGDRARIAPTPSNHTLYVAYLFRLEMYFVQHLHRSELWPISWDETGREIQSWEGKVSQTRYGT